MKRPNSPPDHPVTSCHPSTEGNRGVQAGALCLTGWFPLNQTLRGIMRYTNDYINLPYNPELKKLAKELRHAGSLVEVLLWRELKKNKINGLDFDRQKIIGNYIVDFFSTRGIVIEIDGQIHDYQFEYDEQRDNYLKELGLKVIHITAKDVLSNLNGVVEYLKSLTLDKK
jgi:very-short-patch-repair endonuclease